MEIIRFSILDLDFIKNLPDDMMEELIYFEEVIPDDIMSTIMFHNPRYKKLRGDFLEYRPDLLQKMYTARHRKRRLCEKDYFINVETDLNVQFIKDYPQFKPLVTGVEYKDENRDVIKFVSIDEYLAEN